VKIRRIASSELDAELMARWECLRRQSAVFESPFFHPQFTRRVAEVKTGVEVAIVEMDGEIRAFWPYERISRSLAGPVGGVLSDYHGVVGDMGRAGRLDPRDLLRACRLRAWDFTHFPADQSLIVLGRARSLSSPQIDLSRGFAAYAEDRRAAGSHWIARVAHSERRLAKTVGPLRFVFDDRDVSAFQKLLEWKSAQYARTRNPDLFASGPSRAVLEAIWRAPVEGFSGVLSTLYAGDHLIAAHFGLRSRSVLHYWFPAYDVDQARHSPGLVLMLNLVKASVEAGVAKIDLGAGEDPYKLRLATGSAPLAWGSLEIPGWLNRSRALKRKFIGLLGQSPLAGPGRALRRRLRLSGV
jgi:CelD/BcsL family acetyltransferase involved in cellulose biosynthesis